MSGNVSQISNQQLNYAVTGGGDQDQEVQQLEQAVQDLLNALQNGGGSQGAGQYDNGGAGNGQSPVSSQPPMQSAGDSETQSLEAAVQQLLTSLEQQDGGQGGTGGVGQYAGGPGGAGSGTGGANGMGQGITPPDMSDLQIGSTGSQTQSLEQAAQSLLNALQGGGGQSADPTAAAPTLPTAQNGTGGTSGTDPNATLASDYNNVMAQLSANGNSPQNLQQAVQQFMQDAKAAGPNTDQDVQTAMTNLVKSLSDGTFSQQGSQGALEGAATRDGMSGVTTQSIAGQAGGAAQAAGEFDPTQNQKGALGANTAILESEIANGNGQGSQQITNNATALATEATNQAQTDAAAGNTDAAAQDTALASAAQNIANSANGTGDGTYSGGDSLKALQAALPDSSNTLAAQNPATQAA